jgi:hypothetical protein
MKSKIEYVLVKLGLLPIKSYLQMFFLTFICCFLIVVPFAVVAVFCRLLLYVLHLDPTNLYYDLLNRYATRGINGGLILGIYCFIITTLAILYGWFFDRDRFR